MKELVTVVVPILNPEIDPVEERLLHHCLQMLSGFPLIFISYEGADLSIVREHHADIDVIDFPAGFFSSRDDFARLLLMEDFYARFNWCEYLMIHELNSWIVRDELHYWCKQGYDYFRADPVGVAQPGFVSGLTGLNEAQKMALGQAYGHNGLQLCNIERMMKTLRSLKKTAYQYRHNHTLPNADGVFWQSEANRLWPNLRKPTAVVNAHFAKSVTGLAETNPAKLPFALTGITRANFNQIPFFRSLTEADHE